MLRAKGGRNTKKQKCKSDVTMHGLKRWYEELFEHYGWMVLAKNKNMTDKVAMYKKSLMRLEEKLQCKMTNLHEIDRKNDIHIMYDNVKILCDYANKQL